MARITIADLDLKPVDPFEYEAADGTVYTLAELADVPGDVLLKLEALTLADQVRAVLGPDADAFMKLPAREISAVMDLWSKHNGIEGVIGSLGEGPASPL